MLIQTRRNKLHGVNVFLMALTTISAFFATYLVRSGVVQSVHAFGSGGVGVPLLLFILISVALSFWIALLARRSDTGELAGIESREGFLILTSWLLLALSLIYPYRHHVARVQRLLERDRHGPRPRRRPRRGRT